MERKTIQARAAQKLAAEHYLRIRRRSPGEFFLSQTIGRVNAAPPYSRSVAKRARHRDIAEMGGDRRLPISRFRKGSCRIRRADDRTPSRLLPDRSGYRSKQRRYRAPPMPTVALYWFPRDR